jgi:L-lactate dehydrogenase
VIQVLQVAIIGTGKVGVTLAFTILVKNLAKRLLLVGTEIEKVRGEMYDLRHAQGFLPHSMEIKSVSLSEVTESDVLILTASRKMTDMKDRLELLTGNVEIFRNIVPPLARQNPQAIFIVITNPVDIMTYLTLRWSGFSPKKVIGTGTLIDSGRFRALIGEYSGIHPADVHAYILGEHGESEFAVFSSATVGGMPLTEQLPVCRSTCPVKTVPEVFAEAKDGGMMVYRHKGYTNYAIALAAATLLEAIVEDSGRILPVSTLLEGYAGISNVCLSIPAVIGREGVLKTLELSFSSVEREALHRSAEKLKSVIRSLPL